MSNENTNGTGRKPRLIIHPEDEEAFIKQKPQPQANRGIKPQTNRSGQSQAYQHTQSTAAKGGQKPRLIIHPENEQNTQANRNIQPPNTQTHRNVQQPQNPQTNRNVQSRNRQADGDHDGLSQNTQANQSMQSEANGTSPQKEENTDLIIGLAVIALLIGVVVWYTAGRNSIVGTWREEGQVGTITFEKNGVGYMSTEQDGFSFTYEAKDGKLNLILSANGRTASFAFSYQIKGNTMNMELIGTGEESVLTRVS